MTTYNVQVPDNKNSFFLEFLELIGAKYEKETSDDFMLSEVQKRILLDQEDIRSEECTDAEDFYRELKNKYEL